MKVLLVLFTILEFAVALGLIAIVAAQTTKSEGLTGTLGGKSSVSFHGRAGMEEQMQQWTTYLAVAFMVISAILAYFLLGLRI